MSKRRQTKQATGELEPLRFSSDAQLVLEAAAAGDDGKPRVRKFSMTAYTGGAMLVARYSLPVVVDLQGVTINGQKRPIFKDHDPTQIVGHTESVTLTAQTIKVNGQVSGVGEATQEVVATADNGFPWQASLGATVQQLEFIERGNQVKVNGKKFAGPIYVARKSNIYEFSFVPLGGDDNTTATVAASLARGNTMNFDAWLKAKGIDIADLSETVVTTLRAAFDAEQTDPETDPKPPVKAKRRQRTEEEGDGDGDQSVAELKAELRKEAAVESTRISAIRKLCAANPGLQIKVDEEDVDLEAHAIAENWDAKEVELHILRARRPRGPGIHIADSGRPANEVIEAAMCRMGKLQSETIEASYNDQTLSACDRHYRRGIGLQELLLNCAYDNGYTGRDLRIRNHNIRDVLRAAFSTSDLSGILSNVNNKLLLESFMFVEQTWRAVTAIGEVNDFKDHKRYRLTGDGQFEEVGADGKLKHGELTETDHTNAADTYGKIYKVPRKIIVNDDMHAYMQLPRIIGRGAALKLCTVFWTEYLDNASFFATGNNNYFSGGSSALDSDSLATAETKFKKQKDEKDQLIGAKPAILLTPSELSVTANELYTSTNLNTGGSSTKAKVPNRNIWAGKYRPEESAYLSDSSISGNSALAWYLLADPQDIAVIETVFLDGVETPTVESAEADFDELGIQMKGFWDFGVRKREYRGGVKSKGEA